MMRTDESESTIDVISTRLDLSESQNNTEDSPVLNSADFSRLDIPAYVMPLVGHMLVARGAGYAVHLGNYIYSVFPFGLTGVMLEPGKRYVVMKRHDPACIVRCESINTGYGARIRRPVLEEQVRIVFITGGREKPVGWCSRTCLVTAVHSGYAILDIKNYTGLIGAVIIAESDNAIVGLYWGPMKVIGNVVFATFVVKEGYSETAEVLSGNIGVSYTTFRPMV